MRAVVLPDDEVSRIASGIQKLMLFADPHDIQNQDFVLVPKKSGMAPGTVYVYKSFEIGSDFLFDSLKAMHFVKSKEGTFGKIWPVHAFAIRFREFNDGPIKVEGSEKYSQAFVMVDVCDAGVRNTIDMIKNPLDYDPRKVDNLVLVDDWRIVLAWYSTYKETGKFKYSREAIENLASIILREIIKRGIHINPDDYKEHAKELYGRVIKRIKTKHLFSEYFSADEFYYNGSTFAKVGRGGLMTGQPKITVDEFLSSLSGDFKIKKPYAFLVGGIATHGYTEGDIDILIKDKHPSLAFEFRVLRQLPKEWWGRIQFIYDTEDHGPFTNYVPLYDLRLERLPNKMEEMSSGEVVPLKFFTMLKGIAGYRKQEVYNIEGLLETIRSIPNFLPADVNIKYDGMNVQLHKKGSTVKIYSEDGQDITVRFPSIVKDASKWKDVVVIGELEGWTGKPGTGTHIGRSDVSGYAHSRSEPNDSLFYLQVHDILYNGDRATNELTRNKRIELLDSLSFEQMSHILRIPHTTANDEEALRAAVQNYSKVKGSEGAMIKSMKSTYPLSGMTNLWVKFKNEADIDAQVLSVHPVKGGAGWNYICGIQSGKNVVPVGVTYNTKIERKPGDIIRVAFVNLNKYTDPKTGIPWYNWWAPRPIEAREDRKVPDNTITADRIVKDTHGEIGSKAMPTKYREVMDFLAFSFEDECGFITEEFALSGIEVTDRYGGNTPDLATCCHGQCEGTGTVPIDKDELSEPWHTLWLEAEEKEASKDGWHFVKCPDCHGTGISDFGLSSFMWTDYPTVDKPKFVLQAHIRGRSVHLDDRRQLNSDFGIGMTHPLPYSLSKQPENFEEAKKLFNAEILPKIKEDLSNPMHKYLGIKKAAVPIEWLKVEGATAKGEVGATANEPAFFIILDEGWVEYLTLKPYFHEYQYHGSRGILEGKYIDRLIENRAQWKKVGKETASWMFFKTENPPYVITRRAVNDGWVPPYSVSALPVAIEKTIPQNYQYWKEKNTERRIQIRNALFEAIKKKDVTFGDFFDGGELEDGKEYPFKLIHQTWPHTKEVIRAGPVYERWLLAIFDGTDNVPVVFMETNPIDDSSSSIIERVKKDKLEQGITKGPSGMFNPRNTPVTSENIDEGNMTIGSSDAGFVKFKVHGQKMKGTFALVKEKSGEIWVIERSLAPQVLQQFIFCDVGEVNVKGVEDFADKDISKMTDAELPDVLEITKGKLFRPGTFRGRKYSSDAVSNAKLDPKIVGRNLAYINMYHDKFSELARAGIMTDIWWEPEEKWTAKDGTKGKGLLCFAGTLTDKDAIRGILLKKQYQISAEIAWEIDYDNNVTYMAVTGAALLDNPAVEIAQAELYRGRKMGDLNAWSSGKLPSAM